MGTFFTQRRTRIVVAVLIVVGLFLSQSIPASADVKCYRWVRTEGKKIALTFDDGPHPHLTGEILEILDRYQVKATFFMVGSNVRYYPDTAGAVLAAGHEVGNHTFTHAHVQGLGEKALFEEIARCEDALDELCEYRPHLFRPPEGGVNRYIEHCAEVGDYSLILWSLDTRDWECKNAEQIVRTVLDHVKPGDIILMHDYIGTGSQTPRALEILLPRLLSAGYEPVTVSELLGMG